MKWYFFSLLQFQRCWWEMKMFDKLKPGAWLSSPAKAEADAVKHH